MDNATETWQSDVTIHGMEYPLGQFGLAVQMHPLPAFCALTQLSPLVGQAEKHLT